MNLKFHILAVTVFVILGMAALVITGKIRFGEPPAASEFVAEKVYTDFLQIDSASWGLNCMKYAEKLPVRKALAEDEAPPIPLRRDNVLRPISSLCNGQPYCEFWVDSETLGQDPIPSCTKEFRVEYRCNDLDRVRRMSFYDTQESVLLDCRPPEDADPRAAKGTELTAPTTNGLPPVEAPAGE
jgi:hypothetical protein